MKMDSGLLKSVYWISILTIVYNIIEGIVSVALGYENETLTLLGFGLDSFIETISASGILYMVIRLRKGDETTGSLFERRALRITGWSFYVLSVGLTLGAILNIIQGHKPESTLPGVIISLISILCMVYLVRMKKSLGRKLNSAALIADANCNLVCIYMSVTLLISSAIYHFFKIPYIDAIGTLGLVFFSVREGKEALEQAKTGKCCTACGPPRGRTQWKKTFKS
ncbi:MAG: cation transporter [Bacteroidota bacterium]